MPTFDTPEPITISLEIGVGDIRVAASDRNDAVVTVLPSDPGNSSDVAAAEQTRVEYANGVLLIKSPGGRRQWSPRRGRDSIDVRVDVPAGSHLRGSTAVATLRCTGRLGDCHYKTSVGEIRLDETAAVMLRSGMGDIAANRVGGDADVRTSSGAVRLGAVDGTAVVKNSSGDTWIGEVGGDVRVSGANGSIAIDRAGATVAAQTANGDVRLGEVAGGAVVVQTARGKLDVGIRDGVAAWLDLNTAFGAVRNELDDAPRPAPGDATVEVRGRTAFGDITIRRAAAYAIAGRT